MPLQGNIRDFSTTQLLNLVNLSRRTGMLTIFEAVPTGEKDAMKNEKMAAGSERAKVAFNKGKLVYASLSNQDNGLVAVLNNAGKLTDAQAKVLRDRAQGTSDKALAMRLIGAKYVTQQDIVNCIKNHILDVVYNLTTWSEGPFRFDDNTTPSDDNILVPIELENVRLKISSYCPGPHLAVTAIPDYIAATWHHQHPRSMLSARLRSDRRPEPGGDIPRWTVRPASLSR